MSVPPIPGAPQGPSVPGAAHPGQPQVGPGNQGWPPGTRVVFVPPPPPPSVLPLEPTRYAQFWRAPRWRWWKSPLVLLAGLAAALLVQLVLVLVAAAAGWFDLTGGALGAREFLVNNVGLALLVPVVLLLVWGIVGQRPRWMGSVHGRLRWRPLLVIAALLAPVWVLVSLLLDWRDRSDWQVGEHTWLLIVGIALTTPLQCAGEEYAFRGLVNRAVASLTAHRILGPVLGAIVSTIGFCAAHFAQDLWLNLFYASFGLTAAWLTHRTGGLEAAIAIHVVNNLTSEVPFPFIDLAEVFDRSAGTASFGAIAPGLGLLAFAVLVVELIVRRTTWLQPLGQRREQPTPMLPPQPPMPAW